MLTLDKQHSRLSAFSSLLLFIWALFAACFSVTVTVIKEPQSHRYFSFSSGIGRKLEIITRFTAEWNLWILHLGLLKMFFCFSTLVQTQTHSSKRLRKRWAALFFSHQILIGHFLWWNTDLKFKKKTHTLSVKDTQTGIPAVENQNII